ncbi:hypothetical protein [Desulfosporosinus meridiei]|uniref:Uncharacterized protein n=1 Tax=Desulfosporosinus meridiei (strain ATCC BAA-275 / DSM 13257 / KCTC 12902 / NCIMB 13706 / S10) TaxID=768704 RepID=J7IKX1_DESMD|nr:hypothetical protein [Desulfosporosinus meridiei]AFQ42427.1 hypothetical protein Desmer_0371 [Desulfosporosinus meridiei DSM 13257]
MLARRNKLVHPSGVILETPMLIPSFSSKGFRFNKQDKSEASIIFRVAEEYLTQCLLISAYDGHYGYVPSDDFPTEVVFVDSGGYETSDEHDLSEVMRYVGPIKEWTEDLHKQFLNNWPSHVPGVFISFDHGSIHRTIPEQIEQGRDLFSKYTNQMSDFLLKPENEERYISLQKILDNILLLKDFDIIGFTEKELGKSLLERMQNIAIIRMALDKAGINSPLHIFGSLDPITSSLYFLSGAEIFDGLTWLKYSYYTGKTIYKQNYGALEPTLLNMREETLDATIWARNIYHLESLQIQMKNFLLEHDFRMFQENSELLRNSYDTLCGKLGGRF